MGTHSPPSLPPSLSLPLPISLWFLSLRAPLHPRHPWHCYMCGTLIWVGLWWLGGILNRIGGQSKDSEAQKQNKSKAEKVQVKTVCMENLN